MGVQEQQDGGGCHKDGCSHDSNGKIHKVVQYTTKKEMGEREEGWVGWLFYY